MKKQPKLTPWFPGEVKPVRRGVYERFTPTESTPTFQHWNGEFWGFRGSCIDDAAHGIDKSVFQFEHKWRGLASKPRSAK